MGITDDGYDADTLRYDYNSLKSCNDFMDELLKRSNLLPTDYESCIHQSRYAKYVDGKGRESWAGTVGRYMDNVVRPRLGNDSWSNEIEQAILSLDVMPSMRAMMTSGPALDRDNTAGYNCPYLLVDDPKSLDEAMLRLLCGTCVGFSV